MKIGDIDILKAYLGTKMLTKNNAFLGEFRLITDSQPGPVDPYATPFTITAIEDTQIGMSHYGTNATTTIPQLEYSRDGESWVTWDYTKLSLNAGESLYFRGDNPSGIGHSSSNYSRFTSTAKINLSNNIMSLMHKDDFETNWVVSTYCFYEMFYNNANIVNASELLLPATTLANYCYRDMFNGCTSLVTAPVELPATTLADNCYSDMFRRCNKLTSAPELPATKLKYKCYSDMFNGCTSLVTAPELPATTLADTCYGSMFNGCTSLVTAPELPATTLASSCYQYMFSGCTNLNYIKAMFKTTPGSKYTSNWLQNVSATGTFVKNSAATWDVTGANGIPNGWTVEYADA